MKKFRDGAKNAARVVSSVCSGQGSSLCAQLIPSGAAFVLWQTTPGRYASNRWSLRNTILPRRSRGRGRSLLMTSGWPAFQWLSRNSYGVIAPAPSTSILRGLPSITAASRIGSACETSIVA
ncbi:MAG: hypothetical protein DMG94_07960 [Acidobacteria bacterium]|nr:MAG: hypothetical protein DMG94_07960 [Acidobacteriota bacterium]